MACGGEQFLRGGHVALEILRARPHVRAEGVEPPGLQAGGDGVVVLAPPLQESLDELLAVEGQREGLTYARVVERRGVDAPVEEGQQILRVVEQENLRIGRRERVAVRL